MAFGNELLEDFHNKAAKEKFGVKQVADKLGVSMATANKLLTSTNYKPREATVKKLEAYMEPSQPKAKRKQAAKVRTRKSKVKPVEAKGAPAVREPQLRDRMEQVAHHLMEEKGLMPEYRRRLEALGMGYSR